MLNGRVSRYMYVRRLILLLVTTLHVRHGYRQWLAQTLLLQREKKIAHVRTNQ